VRGALLRYRIIAYATGIGLIVLVFIGVPVRYAAHHPIVVAIVGPLHGFLYIAYLLATLELALRARWSLIKTVLVGAAGTIPFMSFVAERRVRHDAEREPLTPAR